MTDARASLGRVGVWSRQLRNPDRGVVVACAVAIDKLGYSAMWTPELPGDETLANLRACLSSTDRAIVASGVMNIWLHTPAELAGWAAEARSSHPGRFLLGLGASHDVMMDASGVAYGRPLAGMIAFLDQLDREPDPLGRDELILAALGPKMTELAALRTRGAHPYLVTADHVRWARATMGPDAFLAPELKVVNDDDPASARAKARRALAQYAQLPNYTRNLERWGFTAVDFADGCSERLVDSLTAWGTPDTIAARVQEFHDAGADHVCINLVDDRDVSNLVDDWESLAPILLGRGA